MLLTYRFLLLVLLYAAYCVAKFCDFLARLYQVLLHDYVRSRLHSLLCIRDRSHCVM